MSLRSISDIAGEYGLTVESNDDPTFRIFKGVNQIFSGDEDAARVYLADYEKDRPGLFEGSIIGYRE
ncbi:MAG: hypothetical protein DMF63_12880 [Acidobacteria bacterium]|nr:MAG: hypothetical protein DMF63_12880 [Acidobacteriota bacterium]